MATKSTSTGKVKADVYLITKNCTVDDVFYKRGEHLRVFHGRKMNLDSGCFRFLETIELEPSASAYDPKEATRRKMSLVNEDSKEVDN